MAGDSSEVAANDIRRTAVVKRAEQHEKFNLTEKFVPNYNGTQELKNDTVTTNEEFEKFNELTINLK